MSKIIAFNFNTEVKDILTRHNISLHDGITYLLCVYYGTDPSYIPQELERKVLTTNIVTKDYESNEIKWNYPLFEEQETGFEWVSEWMDLFKAVNPERRGSKADVLRRMKRFFMNNPSVRKDDVFKATQNYLKTISEPMYCKKSHKFIYEIDGSSMLLDYVENIESSKNIQKIYDDEDI